MSKTHQYLWYSILARPTQHTLSLTIERLFPVPIHWFWWSNLMVDVHRTLCSWETEIPGVPTEDLDLRSDCCQLQSAPLLVCWSTQTPAVTHLSLMVSQASAAARQSADSLWLQVPVENPSHQPSRCPRPTLRPNALPVHASAWQKKHAQAFGPIKGGGHCGKRTGVLLAC